MNKRFKFGDRILNDWAGEKNPNRIGVFVKYKRCPAGKHHSTETIELTDMKGKFWEVYNDDSSKNKKIGTILDREKDDSKDIK